MKKVGVLFGKEDTFPWALIDRINEKGDGKVVAEPVMIDKVEQGKASGYDVIFDRISQDVPFYRAYLKNAALMGTAVINNPFWWSADEKFFNNCLMTQIGVPVPKTVLLPSKERPDDTGEMSFRNMKLPLDWEYIFDYIGFPAYMKPHSGGGWKSVYKVEDMQDLFRKHEETGQLVMMLQEEIEFDDYYRVYCIGRKYVKIMPYEPRNPHHLRYQTEPKTTGDAHTQLMQQITDLTLKINHALGYDFNTVEFALRDGVPYAIDFCNPAPDADVHSVGQENFDWVVEHAAQYAIELAEAQKENQSNVTWGNFVKDAVSANASTTQPAKKATAAKGRSAGKTKVSKTSGKASTRSTAKTAETTESAAERPVKKPVARRTKKS